MPDFKPGQTIINYIYHNKELIRKLLLGTYTYAQLAKILTDSNDRLEKLTSTRLLHIVHYLLAKPKSEISMTRELPEPTNSETILEYIKANKLAVIIHKRSNTFVITADFLTNTNKCGDKISSHKLGDVCKYIEEELRQYSREELDD